MTVNDVVDLVLGDTVEFTEDVCELVAPEDEVVGPLVCRPPSNAREVHFMARDDPVVQLVEHGRDFQFRGPNPDMRGPRRRR